MRYLRIPSALLLLVALPWNHLIAQDQELPDPPKPPLIERLPSSAQWLIKHPAGEAKPDSAASAAQSNARVISTIQVTKTDALRRELISWVNGATSERWFTGPYLIETEPNQSDIYITFNNPNADIAVQQKFGNFSATDFPEVDWVSPATYSGIATFRGRTCYLFKREVKFRLSPDSPIMTSAQQAWIDGPTRRPIAFDNGSYIRTYHFDGATPTTLSIPPAFVAKLEKYQKRMAPPASIKLN